jgi:hypothetical protein
VVKLKKECMKMHDWRDMMRFLKGLFKFLMVVIIVLVVAAGAVYYLISSPAKLVDVTYSEQDFQSYLAKGGIDFNDNHASAEDFFAGNVIARGKTPVTAVVTNQELTAIANRSMNENSVMKNVKIKCIGDDELVMSCELGDIGPLIEQFPVLEKFRAGLKLVENKPIYMHATLFYDENTQKFDGVTKELYVGKLKIPTSQANDNLEAGGTALNRAIKNLNGFSVNSFKVTEEGFDFDGTIPETIESAGSFGN